MNERLALRRCKERKRVGTTRFSWLAGEAHIDFEAAYQKLAKSYGVDPQPPIINHHEDDQEPRYISAAQFLAGLRFKRSDAH